VTKTGVCAHPGRHRYWATCWHHILPQSWGGPTVAANLIELCDSHHVGAHVLIDLGVAAGADPSTLPAAKGFTPTLRALAKQAWDQRPAVPTRTRIADTGETPHG